MYAKSPNAKLNVAIVGPCGRGEAQLEAAGTMENVVGVCDIDDNNLAAVARRYPKAKAYVDFRKMLDEMHKSIDAVMVSTPDHTHAPAAAMAIRLDKHCYCEKPLTHSVYETRVLAEIAKEKKLVTQMGTQIHAEDNYRRVVELIQSGAIGPVSEVLAWCGRSWGDGRRPKDTPPVPKHPLGRVDRPGEVPPLPSLLSAGELAVLVGFRQRHLGRHGLPHHGRRVLGAEAAVSDHDRGRRAAGQRRRLPKQIDGPLPVSRPWRDAAGEADVV